MNDFFISEAKIELTDICKPVLVTKCKNLIQILHLNWNIYRYPC